LEFSPDGNALYIVSFGKSEHRITLPNGEPLPLPTFWSYPNTGIIWKVANSTTISATEPPPKKLRVSPELTIAINSGNPPPRNVFSLPSGYKIEPILWNLNLPGSFAFDDKGNMYIGEVGYAYVGLIPPPRILKVDHQTGNVSVFVDRGLDRPLTDIAFHKGKLYVSNGGRISTVDMKGIVNNIIVALPGIGDHYVDQIAFGPDGRFYFGIGTATNGAVVGKDNPWIKFIPKFHEIPGKNITLAGVNFKTRDYLSPALADNTTTGAYVPFGTSTKKGQIIKGDTKCTGCILSAKEDGTDLKLVAWGLRHPYGLAFGEDGKLIISMNGIDERGSRNVANDGDNIPYRYLQQIQLWKILWMA
jgi:glucose/arabinose dehydrogenase